MHFDAARFILNMFKVNAWIEYHRVLLKIFYFETHLNLNLIYDDGHIIPLLSFFTYLFNCNIQSNLSIIYYLLEYNTPITYNLLICFLIYFIEHWHFLIKRLSWGRIISFTDLCFLINVHPNNPIGFEYKHIHLCKSDIFCRRSFLYWLWD